MINKSIFINIDPLHGMIEEIFHDLTVKSIGHSNNIYFSFQMTHYHLRRYKSWLFLTTSIQTEVAHMGVSLGQNEVVLSHGKASFMKQEKVAKLLREGWELGAGLSPAVDLTSTVWFWDLPTAMLSIVGVEFNKVAHTSWHPEIIIVWGVFSLFPSTQFQMFELVASRFVTQSVGPCLSSTLLPLHHVRRLGAAAGEQWAESGPVLPNMVITT